MRNYFLALALLCAAPLMADQKPCAECRSKHAQKTTHVLILEWEGQTHHIAHYLGGCVDTVIEGPEKGLQVIYLMDAMVASSENVTWNGDEFVHRYDRWKVCSSPTEQWIRYTK